MFGVGGKLKFIINFATEGCKKPVFFISYSKIVLPMQ